MCNSSQTPIGRNTTDEEVEASSAVYDEVGAGGGGGVDSNDQGQDGILRAAARAVWGKLRPNVVDDFGECPLVWGVGGSSSPLLCCQSFKFLS